MVNFQFRIFMYSDIDQTIESNWSQPSRKCPWRVLVKSKTKQPVPVQPSGRAFEGVRMPRIIFQIMMKTSGRQSITIWMLGQSLFNMVLDFRSRNCLESLCKSSGRRGNTFGRCPVFQNIPEFHSNAERIKRRPSEGSVKSFRREPDKDRITLFLKGYHRKPFKRG
jgi:hypothetical protein